MKHRIVPYRDQKPEPFRRESCGYTCFTENYFLTSHAVLYGTRRKKRPFRHLPTNTMPTSLNEISRVTSYLVTADIIISSADPAATTA